MENSSSKEIKESNNGGDLECEDAIMKDKERFGRARTGLMKQLRLQYGQEVADRALLRINKRVSQNSMKIKKHLSDAVYDG